MCINIIYNSIIYYWISFYILNNKMNNIKTYDNSYNFYRILYLYHIFLLSNNIFIYIEDYTHSPLRARSIPDFHIIFYWWLCKKSFLSTAICICDINDIKWGFILFYLLYIRNEAKRSEDAWITKILRRMPKNLG